MKIINIKQQKNLLSSMSSPIVSDLAIKYNPYYAEAYHNKSIALNKLGKYLHSQAEEAFIARQNDLEQNIKNYRMYS